jgi:hypothetical protein
MRRKAEEKRGKERRTRVAKISEEEMRTKDIIKEGRE